MPFPLHHHAQWNGEEARLRNPKCVVRAHELRQNWPMFSMESQRHERVPAMDAETALEPPRRRLRLPVSSVERTAQRNVCATQRVSLVLMNPVNKSPTISLETIEKHRAPTNIVLPQASWFIVPFLRTRSLPLERAAGRSRGNTRREAAVRAACLKGTWHHRIPRASLIGWHAPPLVSPPPRCTSTIGIDMFTLLFFARTKCPGCSRQPLFW